MEHMNSDGEEDSQHDSAMPCSLNNSAELEQDDHSGFTISELKMEFEKMCSKLPLILDLKQETDSHRCHSKSCPWGNKLGSPHYLSSASPHKDFPECCIGLGNRASDFVSIFYRTPLPCSLNNSAELEQDDHSGFTISELKMEFEKMCSKLPLILALKQETDSHRCHSKSCPWGNKLGSPHYLSSASPHKDFPECCIGLGNRASESVSIFYRTPSLFSIPVNLRSSGFSFESQSNQRSTKSISDRGDFIVKCSPAAASDVIVSPSGRWIFESTETDVKVRAVFESLLLFQLGVLDGRKRPHKSISADTRPIKSSELCSSPSRFKKNIQRRMNVSETKLVSCSSTNSTCSHISTSSANSFSKGLLYFVRKGGIPYFVLSLDNDAGDVYVANPQKVEPSVDKALDYVYLFCSRNSRKHHTNASGVVGKMKVSSSLTLNSNRSKFMETEFVLFGRREDYFKEIEGSSSTITKSKRFSKKMAEVFRSSRTIKNKAIHKFGEPSFQFDDFMRDMFEGELRDLNEVDNVNHFIQDFSPNLELAAIVVKDCRGKRNEVATGGWGLKFLEKVQVSDADNSEESSFSCKNNETDCNIDWGDRTRRMNVLVPVGFHGGPIHRTGEASSLTERWKSGGHCDCGGWDLGCPLTVLDNNYVFLATLIDDEPGEDCPPFCLFVEGMQHGEPTLRMVNQSKDLYHINFHSSLSALLSFAIAVAIIHSRTPDLYPTL